MIKEHLVDGRKEACPRPVIMTKKKLDSIDEGVVTTIVDNEVAKENVSKLATSLGYEFSVRTEGEDYYITIKKGEVEVGPQEKKENIIDQTIALASNTMGKGEEKLGEILMKSFIYTVSETQPYPKTIVLYNSGVRLTCEGSEVLDDLIKLENEGVEIISCGTCLDFLNIKDSLKVGSISNMYTIYEKISNAKKNMIIG